MLFTPYDVGWYTKDAVSCVDVQLWIALLQKQLQCNAKTWMAICTVEYFCTFVLLFFGLFCMLFVVRGTFYVFTVAIDAETSLYPRQMSPWCGNPATNFPQVAPVRTLSYWQLRECRTPEGQVESGWLEGSVWTLPSLVSDGIPPVRDRTGDSSRFSVLLCFLKDFMLRF